MAEAAPENDRSDAELVSALQDGDPALAREVVKCSLRAVSQHDRERLLAGNGNPAEMAAALEVLRDEVVAFLRELPERANRRRDRNRRPPRDLAELAAGRADHRRAA